jgi:hypothetical protein
MVGQRIPSKAAFFKLFDVPGHIATFLDSADPLFSQLSGTAGSLSKIVIHLIK